MFNSKKKAEKELLISWILSGESGPTNPNTGLPSLPTGFFWRVGKDYITEYGTRVRVISIMSPRAKHMLSREATVWTPTHSQEELIRDGANALITSTKERRASDSLTGDYPPNVLR